MIIRNGFVRDVEGRWHNMSHVILFRVERLINKGYAIYAVMDLKPTLIKLTNQFEYEDDAYLELDDAFGYEG